MKKYAFRSFSVALLAVGFTFVACSSGGSDDEVDEGGSLGQGGSAGAGGAFAGNGGQGGSVAGASGTGGVGHAGTSANAGSNAVAGSGGSSAGAGGASAGAGGANGGSADAGSGGNADAGSAGQSGSAGAGGADAGASGAGGSSGASGEAGAGGDAAGGASGASGSGGAQAGGGAGGTTGGSSGAAGAGGAFVWPTCDTQPVGSPTKTLHDIWTDDPMAPTAVWVPGVFVTAISYGACTAGIACEIFVQQAETFADLASGSQQSMKMFISANTAQHFVGVSVGDQVNAYGWAWRYDVGGQNELLLQVSLTLPGCAKPIGTGVPTPVTVALSDLTVSAYEDTVGPLLIELPTVSGKPVDGTSIFALWDTATGPSGNLTDVTSLTPFYLTGGNFSGLTDGKVTDFTHAIGVFSLYLESSSMTKYKTIGPRVIGEAPILKVH